jgi:hypothetical protein
MALSSIGGSQLIGISQTEASSPREKMATKMLQELDTDQNGQVSKAENTSFGAQMKAKSPNVGQVGTPAASVAPTPEQQFAVTDQNGDSNLSIDELSSMLAKNETQQPTRAAIRAGQSGAGAAGGPPPGGPPPGGPPPAGKSSGGGVQSSSSASGDSSQTTDPADSNGDGIVSASEKLIYEMTHPTVATQGSSA